MNRAAMEFDELSLHVWRGASTQAGRRAIPTGFAALDERLPGGGWPRGALTEILVDRYGIGELSLLIPALAALTRPVPGEAKKWIAWVAPPFIPYAPALEQRGVDVERLLMIHPSKGGKSRLWAVEQIVRSGSSSGVLAWLAVADDVELRRLQLAAEGQDCWTVLFRPVDALRNRSPAALRIRLAQQAEAVHVEIIKCRGGSPGTVAIPLHAYSGEETSSEAEAEVEK
jgi:hypothetical protein